MPLRVLALYAVIRGQHTQPGYWVGPFFGSSCEIVMTALVLA